MACGILVLQPEIEPELPALKVQSLNHWTTREVPKASPLPTMALFLTRLHDVQGKGNLVLTSRYQLETLEKRHMVFVIGEVSLQEKGNLCLSEISTGCLFSQIF